MDLTFIVDTTYLLAGDYATAAKNFMTSIVNALPIGTSNTLVSVISSSLPPVVNFQLNQYSTSASVQAAIQALAFSPAWTDIGESITLAQSSVFTPGNGDRANYPNVIIIILAVPPNQPGNSASAAAVSAQAAAASAIAAGIKIFAVGSDTAPASLVQSLTSSPQSLNVNYYMPSSFTQYASIQSTLLANLCPSTGPAPTSCARKYTVQYVCSRLLARFS